MAIKPMLHPRNQHREGYDFERLIVRSPELEAFTTRNPRGRMTIDFSDVDAVRTLNQALLLTHYDIEFWEIPATYLCPRSPGGSTTSITWRIFLLRVMAERSRTGLTSRLWT